MSREIPVYSVKASKFSYEYFETIKKSMITQILDASEYLLDSNIDTTIVCTIDILGEDGDSLMLFDCKVTYSDIVNELHKLMPWIIENEEYELAHRVKLIEERISTDK